MPGNISVRRLAEDGETMHHKQKKVFRGTTYLVSKVLAPAFVPVAAAKGFTEVKHNGKWVPIQTFVPQAHGGDHTSRKAASPVLKRPALAMAASQVLKRPAVAMADSPVLTRPALAMDAPRESGPPMSVPAVFSVPGTTVLISNLPADVELRKNTRAMAQSLGFVTVLVPQGTVGKDVVASAKRSTGLTCMLTIGEEFVHAIGAAYVLIRTKRPGRSVGAFGCAMTHANILNQIRASGHLFRGDMETYACVFEDDARLRFSPEETRHIIETLMNQTLQEHREKSPDVVYLHNWSAKPKSPQCIFAEMPWPRACGPGQGVLRLLQTKSSYSTAAFLIKRSAAVKVLAYLDVTVGTIYSSDGAVRAACTAGEIVAAHVEYNIDGAMARFSVVKTMAGHEKGGSRVASYEKQ